MRLRLALLQALLLGSCTTKVTAPEYETSPTATSTSPSTVVSATSSGAAFGSDATSSEATSAGGGTSSSTTTSGTPGNGGTSTDASCVTADVRTIFQASCAQSLCHDSNQPAAMLDLSGADPGGRMLGVTSELCPDRLLVVAGQPEQSWLWLKLTQDTPECGERMPLATTLLDAELRCVEEWIRGLASGVTDCETCGGTACVDVTNDAGHCGACDVACDAGQVCEDGACVGCTDGRTACGTACVDTDNDADHCGGCGMACGVGESCVAGICQCSAGEGATFSGEIAPLLASSCGGNACHGGRMPKESLDLTEEASYADLVGVTADQCNDGRLLVDPGNPAASYLMHKLTGVDLCSGSLMPKAEGALAPEALAQISAWICRGAPND